jgi:hypothetical protein
MNGRGNHTHAGRFEITKVVGGGRDICSPKEGVVAASGTLDESIDGSADRGTPEQVGLVIVPIGNDKTRSSTENNAEIGVGVEDPLASKSGIGDAGLARAIAGLEVLGARFERQNLDSKGKPKESGPEASLTSE